MLLHIYLITNQLHQIMKTFITTILLFVAINVCAQSTYSFTQYGSSTNDSGIASALNPWFGSRLGFSIEGDGSLSNGFFASGEFILPLSFISSEKFVVPIVTNINSFKSTVNIENSAEVTTAITDLASGDKGVVLGIHPAKMISGDKHIVLYGQAGIKWNRFVTDTINKSGTDILQFQIGIGMEFGFIDRKSENGLSGKKLLLSINPMISTFATSDLDDFFDADSKSYFKIETTLIYGLDKGIGLVAEYVYGNDITSPLNIGIVFALTPEKK